MAHSFRERVLAHVDHQPLVSRVLDEVLEHVQIKQADLPRVHGQAVEPLPSGLRLERLWRDALQVVQVERPGAYPMELPVDDGARRIDVAHVLCPPEAGSQAGDVVELGDAPEGVRVRDEERAL